MPLFSQGRLLLLWVLRFVLPFLKAISCQLPAIAFLKTDSRPLKATPTDTEFSGRARRS